jgi:hypothetical protein
MRIWIRTTTILALVTALLVTTRARAGDPTTMDCLSASEKSIALRAEHKLRSARAQVLVCASTNCPTDIRKECARRVDEVNLAIPTIVFGAKDPMGNDLTAVRMTMDGEAITDKLEGTAISLDPGVHTFTFEAAGQPLLTKQMVVRQGEKERREIVQIGNLPAPPPVAPVVVAVPVPPPPPPPAEPLGKTRVAALAVGVVGVVGLGVGAAFGGLSSSKNKDAKAVCPSSGCPTQQGVDLWSTARLYGNVSTAAVVGGGVALAGGLVLWFAGGSPGPRKSARSSSGGRRLPEPPQVGVGVGSISAKGAW